MKKTTLLVSGLLLSAGVSFGQTLSPSVIASAGDVYSNGTVSLAWTLGELAVSTINSGSNLLTQGFHQPELNIPIGISQPKGQLHVNAFPNPVSDNLVLEVNSSQADKFAVEITDVLGRVVKTSELSYGDGKTSQTIRMEGFAPGAYLVKVNTVTGQFSKTFKITKL